MTEESTGFRLIPTADVKPNPQNPRKKFDEAKLSELAASIREHGVVEPLVVIPADEDFLLVCGERRWRAALLAECPELPCIVRQLTPDEASEIMIVENLQRQDLDPIEEVEGFMALMRDHSYTPADLAQAAGLSLGQVQERLKLLRLPEEVRAAVADRKLSPTASLELLRVEGTPLFKDLAKRFVDDPPAARAATEAVRREISWKGRAIYPNSYSFPFDVAECQRCAKAPLITAGNGPGGSSQQRYCLDDKCRTAKKKAWDKAQTEAALDADRGDAIDGSKLGSNDYVSFTADYRWRGIDQTECETCPNRRNVRFGPDHVITCCVNAVCYNNRRVAADAAEREAAEAKDRAAVLRVLDASSKKAQGIVCGDFVRLTREQVRFLLLERLTDGRLSDIEDLMRYGFNQTGKLWSDPWKLSDRVTELTAFLDGLNTNELAGLLFDIPAWCRRDESRAKWLQEYFGLAEETEVEDDEDLEDDSEDEEVS